MNDINLSFCIPTYNRARYLSCLLEVFYKTYKKFNFSYEIIISNNASSDLTDEVIQKYIDLLPIRYYRQTENIGAEQNIKFTARQASGELLMYLADDDLFEINGLNNSVEKMLQDTNAAILYAPWILKNLLDENENILFYETNDVCILKNDHKHLAKHIISNNIWSEIFIVRSKYFKLCNASFGDLAYWAYTIPCEYLNFGNILYSSQPFYISITSYFQDEIRDQAGNIETEYAWDRYRGGLEFLLGRAIDHLSHEEIITLRDKIDQIILDRMIVGLKLRINSRKNPLEIYQLASRIRGLGGEAYLPVEMQKIRINAILHYLTCDLILLEEVDNIYLLGSFDSEFIEEIKSRTDLAVNSGMDLQKIKLNTLILIEGDVSESFNLHPSIKVVTEKQLLSKFF